MLSKISLSDFEPQVHNAPRGFCPHVLEPFPGCYCQTLTHSTIPLAIYFCAEFYVQCTVFRDKSKNIQPLR